MITSPPTSRKDFLAGAVVGAGALLVGCGQDEEPSPARGAGARDVTILNRALDREHASVALYMAGLGLTRHSGRDAIETLLEQERDHVRRLTEAIRDLGGAPRESLPPATYRKRLDLGSVGQKQFMRLAVQVENGTIASYLEHLPSLSDGRLRQTAAAIMANEAEHVAVLTGVRGPGRPAAQVPDAFVGNP